MDVIPNLFDIGSLQPNIIRIQTSGSQAFEDLDDHAHMTFGKESLDIKAEDLEVVGNVLGRGAYGVVQKMKHRPTNIDMAVKRITATDVTYEQKQLRMDIDVARRSGECVHIVHHYGAIYRDGDVWICMEIMDSSLEKFYQAVFSHGETIPEYVLSHIAFSVVSALNFLHKTLKVIHRDVKPTNMLLSRNGDVKVCDFGVSGYLEDSIAKTIEAGCKPYMAPERIDPQGDPAKYNIKSDVWSFGISMLEISTGQYPYSRWTSVFEQLKQVVLGDAPRLPQGSFSEELCHFVELCLDKQVETRVSYPTLMEHSFLQHRDNTDIAPFVTRILDLPPAEEMMQL
jgi:serine/threonine protein kinase